MLPPSRDSVSVLESERGGEMLASPCHTLCEGEAQQNDFNTQNHFSTPIRDITKGISKEPMISLFVA
jgi:hypothetical protein